jgi:hypothetical protein
VPLLFLVGAITALPQGEWGDVTVSGLIKGAVLGGLDRIGSHVAESWVTENISHAEW